MVHIRSKPFPDTAILISFTHTQDDVRNSTKVSLLLSRKTTRVKYVFEALT